MKVFDFPSAQSSFPIKKAVIGLVFLGLIYGFAIFFLSKSLPEDRISQGNSNGFSEFDVDDLGCNGYPMDTRIETQRRILESIRNEIHSKARELEKITTKFEALTKFSNDKKNELETIQLEIEVARRELRDWTDKRNVRVFLPKNPLETRKFVAEPLENRDFTFKTLEEAVDFSKCSITKFLKIYVYPITGASQMAAEYYKNLKSLEISTDQPESACFYVVIIENRFKKTDYPYFNEKGRNHLVINLGNETIVALNDGAIIVDSKISKISNPFHWPLFLRVSETFDWRIFPQLQPVNRKYFLNFFFTDENLKNDAQRLEKSAIDSMDKIIVSDCVSNQASCLETKNQESVMEDSIFTVLYPDSDFYEKFWMALSKGSIPVVLTQDLPLPFQDCIDWQESAIRVPFARFPELHFILRSIPMKEIIQYRLNGRKFFENYIGNIRGISRTLFACLSKKLLLPAVPLAEEQSIPLFGTSFTAPFQIPINQPNRILEEEYLGPLEGRVESPKYDQNFTSLQLYSKRIWSSEFAPLYSPEFLPFAVDLPYLNITDVDTGLGLRPIAPGSGKEFKEALGGNLGREDFTVVMPTYNRDLVLEETLKKLHRLKNLNKVIIIWNSVDRDPPTSWPLLHVPVEFIRPKSNSLNNRFLPWDRINTEAVLSIDDDIDIRKDEIDLAFRIWRENRDRIVGFPARFHAQFGDELFYNSNKTCQYSMILTGYSFLHKSYLHAYSKVMHEDVRKHVDSVMNCEDIAMNFLVSYLTQKPPLKVTTKWTLKCPTCAEKLSDDESHFSERHECIRLFSKIFGHNPLKNSQYRADSVLFKTRVEGNAQKCYNSV